MYENIKKNDKENRNKRVLIVSQSIPQWYVDTLTDALGEQVKVDIITGSDIEGNVIRSPEHAAESIKSRLVCWYRHLRFISRWMKKNKKVHYDFIFATSNPPINSYLGLKLKRYFKAPFVYMNWDLYPQIVQETIKNFLASVVCGLWHNWNRKHYSQIDQMLTIGSHMAESINSGLKNLIEIQVIPIPVDTKQLRPVEKKDNLFCKEHNLCDKFIVLYSGKMGLGHNIELILEASKCLQNFKNICFVFIGNGSKYSVVEQFIKENHVQNVKLFSLQPEKIFPYSVACGDIGVVSQEASMAQLFMPSKTYSMMACGEAIVGICTEQDDLSSLIKNCQVGVAVTDGNPNTLAEEIRRLYEDVDTLNQYKKRSLMIAQTQYSREVITEQYRKLFDQFLC